MPVHPSDRSSAWRVRCTSLSLCLAAAAGIGCSRIEHAEQCHQLAATVNPALDGIEQLRRSRGDNPETHRQLAARYDRLAVALRQLTVSDPELDELVTEYSGQFRRAAHTLRKLADASQRRNLPRQARCHADLESVVRREQVLAKRIHHRCHAP